MTENTLSADQLLQQWDSLDLGGVQAGTMLAGTIIADKPPNRGATKGILKKAWSGFGEAKIVEVKDKIFAITVTSPQPRGRRRAPSQRYSDPVAGVDHILGLGFGGTAGSDIPALTAEQEESLHLSSVPSLGTAATPILSEEHSLALGMGHSPMEFGNQPMLLGTLIHDSNMMDATISLKPSSGRTFLSRAHDTCCFLVKWAIGNSYWPPSIRPRESLGSCLGPILGNHMADVDQPFGYDPFLLGQTIERIMGTRQQGVDSNFVHGWSCKTSSKGRMAKCIASVFAPDLTPAK
ncbi:hypothetical protein Pyn_23110 [Prunus yedoensis var. nudiflora]|uniref:Uncharacterized protein n=1 Tax=Prunus yedoensis var. nudiflora TaxID=2094558 RepID=A0A314Y3Z3_PRUYE|nr:hypothetical protein Pyn_23110 [Prunus yedoensis var. nudiflora]